MAAKDRGSVNVCLSKYELGENNVDVDGEHTIGDDDDDDKEDDDDDDDNDDDN